MKTLIMTLIASCSFALLPPLAQSTRELQTLLADEHMQEWLGSAEAIREIIRNETGYLITTTHYMMQVDLHYVPHEGKWVGPAKFKLEFNHPVRLSLVSEP